MPSLNDLLNQNDPYYFRTEHIQCHRYANKKAWDWWEALSDRDKEMWTVRFVEYVNDNSDYNKKITDWIQEFGHADFN